MAKTKIGTWNSVPVYTDFLPIGTRRTGQRLDSGVPKFAVFHDTGNRDTSAQQNVNYYKNTFNIDWSATASAHLFVDDTECVICIPVTEKAWHVLYNTPTDNAWYGDDANDIAFGIEVSYYSDRERSRKSLDNACRIMAALCNSWNINPKTQMPGHQDIQADKIDPGNLLEACGYARRDMSVIDNLIVKYMDGDAPIKKVAQTVEKPVEIPKDIKPWKLDSKGNKYRSERANFTVTVDDGIQCYYSGPSLKNGKAAVLKKGNAVNYDTVYLADGYVWIKWKADDGKNIYAPISKVNSSGNAVKLWGKIKK
ncbi:N-acetylmuramoyl-L-alanine amidase [Macrococcoides canis]|uniref:N-acetylmuramoyl-L-alanine amidase n=1 Tax=Macrococcoides canis TaxID=1855823 RepID=UPI001F1B8FE3|nr:N-acetylmuramoyl-L-alanine amidase [Macrococcus canis]UJS28497.1 N-acetylmuramoyl-L-alanine amidase [Macrococcus canis]